MASGGVPGVLLVEPVVIGSIVVGIPGRTPSVLVAVLVTRRSGRRCIRGRVGARTPVVGVTAVVNTMVVGLVTGPVRRIGTSPVRIVSVVSVITPAMAVVSIGHRGCGR